MHAPIAVAWPSGLRRWIKAPVSSGAWVRIPLLPNFLLFHFVLLPFYFCSLPPIGVTRRSLVNFSTFKFFRFVAGVCGGTDSRDSWLRME